jgi:adenylate cyclase
MLANAAAIREDAVMDFSGDDWLDGLEGESRTAREQLLQYLSGEGFSLEQLTAAVNEDRLALLPVDRVLGGSYSASEVEEQTGLPAALMIQIRRQHGLPQVGPEARVFSDEDIEAARSTKLFLEAGFDQEAIIEITRVLGEGMARLAATITASFTETFLRPGDSEEEVALRFANLAERLTPALSPILVAGFKSHLRDSVGRGMLGRAELEAGDLGGGQEIAVCFADLVGFTRLGGQVELRELGTVAGRLASLAASVTEEPVRLIKTIGDAAMFVSPEAAPLVQVALALVSAVEQAELPSLRAGVAIGPALVRAGDYYGNSVNMASRVTGIARAGSVLCTQEVRDAAGDGFEWSAAGRHKLKGVQGQVPLYRARLLGGRHGSDEDRGDDSPPAPAEPADQTEGKAKARKPRADRSRRRASH